MPIIEWVDVPFYSGKMIECVSKRKEKIQCVMI